MNYIQYLALTMGVRWLFGYITDKNTGRDIEKQINDGRLKPVKFRYTISLIGALLFTNYISYLLLAYSLPILIDLWKGI